MSYSKYKYEQSKKERGLNKKTKNKEIKEIRFKPFIGIGDYNNKVKRIKEFLDEKHRVKVVIRITGRTAFDNADNLMARIVQDTAESGSPEFEPKREGKTILTLLQPTK